MKNILLSSLLVIAIFLSGCTQQSETTTTISPTTTKPITPTTTIIAATTQPQTTTTQTQPQTYNVEMKNFAFSPSTLTIKKGDTVVWTNRDSTQHTVTSDSGTELNSERLSQEETYSHTFNTQGTFSYHCTPHPSMNGKIIVQ